MTRLQATDRLTLRGAVEEIIPALSAAGLTTPEIRAISAETQRRMGEGGSPSEWLLTMARVIGETGNETAMRAYGLAIDVWAGPKPGGLS